MLSLISCIVPVFNGEKYLAEAIESILKQSYRPIEISIADDGSKDGTAMVAKRLMCGSVICAKPMREPLRHAPRD
jgi:glycosyltransferase involved in cell wall biosynthesis